MAHFFDPISEEPVTTLKIPTTGTFKIGLFGGGPEGVLPLGQAVNDTRLDVTSLFVEGWSDPLTPRSIFATDSAVIADHDIGSNRRILTVRAGRLRSDRLYALYYGSQYAQPVNLIRIDVRKSIVEFARSFAAKGFGGRKCHYLWGTAGNTPGRADGNPGGGKRASAVLRAASVNLASSQNAPARAGNPDTALGVRIAMTSIDGHNTCAGRSNNYKNSVSAADLANYLKAANDLASSRGGVARVGAMDWPGLARNGLHPRIYYWKGDVQESGNVVWGEACDGIPHFDCVGLVNYCHAFHVVIPGYPNFGGDIAWWWDLDSSGVGKTITDPTDVKDADVVIKADKGHIAMIYIDGEKKKKIVQAEGTAIGLNDDQDYKPGDWGKRVRVADSYLVVKKDHL